MFRHLRVQNVSYLKHMWKAFGIGLEMILGGIFCIIHAFLPFLFPRVASRIIRRLYSRV